MKTNPWDGINADKFVEAVREGTLSGNDTESELDARELLRGYRDAHTQITIENAALRARLAESERLCEELREFIASLKPIHHHEWEAGMLVIDRTKRWWLRVCKCGATKAVERDTE